MEEPARASGPVRDDNVSAEQLDMFGAAADDASVDAAASRSVSTRGESPADSSASQRAAAPRRATRSSERPVASLWEDEMETPPAKAEAASQSQTRRAKA